MSSGFVYGNSYSVCRKLAEVPSARSGQLSGVCAPHPLDCFTGITVECISKLEQVMTS